jgi:glycine cleavage system H protein
MNIPEDLRYSSDHEWARVEGDLIRVGITDYAQDHLGDVVFLQLPEVGSKIDAGASFGEVESTKSVSDLYSPVSGEIVEVNTDLEADPQLVNRDPYGDGWICVIRGTVADLEGATMDAAAYRELTSD